MTLLARRSRARGAPAGSWLAFVCLGWLLWQPSALAGVSSPSEYEVKAAFLFNFAKFVEWPAWTFDRAGGQVILAVLGTDPFPALERIAREERVQGRPIVIRRARRVEEVGDCHILFVMRRDDASVDQIIRRGVAPFRLVVGEDPNFAERGGGIGFFLEARRVRFAINLTVTDRAGLKVSSKMLKVAKVLRD